MISEGLIVNSLIDQSEDALEWRRAASIDSAYWKAFSGQRWAVRHHYTCSYMAMFPPELPHYFIHKFTERGDLVLDPFSGRGTTPVQAMSQLRTGIGNDFNDLAYALSNGKVANPSEKEVLDRLSGLEKKYNEKKLTYDSKIEAVIPRIRMIYSDYTLSQLLFLKDELNWRPTLRSTKHNPDRFITMILMGAMHGSSSGFLSISMPNTFSMGWNYVEKYIEKHDLKKPERNVFEVLSERCKRTLKDGVMSGIGTITIGDSKKPKTFKHIEEQSIDLIFTSPPYMKVIKYGLYNWIRLWFLLDSGDHKEVDLKLDDSHSMNNYLNFMRTILENMKSLMNPNTGVACWVIGDVTETRNGNEITINLAEMVAEVATELGYRVLDIVEDKIESEEKVTKIWNSDSLEEDKSGKATAIDRILILGLDSIDLDLCQRKITQNESIKWDRILRN